MSDDAGFTVTSLEYVRMCVEVVGWADEAADNDERDRLLDLAQYYLDHASDAAEKETELLYAAVSSDIRSWIDGGRSGPAPPITAEDYEAICAWQAVTPVGALDVLHQWEMLDLADMFEGWGMDPRWDFVASAESMGLADGMRTLAKAAGPKWRRRPDARDSVLTALARYTRRN